MRAIVEGERPITLTEVEPVMSITSPQRFGSLVIDRDAREVLVDGHPVNLTKTEFALLATLAEQPRRAFSSEYLLRLITGNDWIGETHALQVYVSRLRTKLGESGTSPRLVQTVHGYGYRFEPGIDDPDAVARRPAGLEVRPAFLLLNMERRIMWASDYVQSLLGWRARELESVLLVDLVHPEDQRRAIAAGPGLTEGRPADFVMRLRTAADSYHHIETLTRPIVGVDGKTVAFHSELRPARGSYRAITRRPVALHLKSA